MARLLLHDLSPGRTYNIQVRAVNANSASGWSPLFTFQTIGDNIAPATPTGLSWTVVGTSFSGTWVAPTTNSDGSPLLDFKDYKIIVTNGATSVTYFVTEPRFDFPFEANTNAFGTPKATVQISVQARDQTGNLSTPAVTATATNPPPAQPANLAAIGTNETINIKWDAVTDTDLDHYEVYIDASASTFTPGPTNLVFKGLATNFTFITTTYSPRFIKVCAVDVFGTQSTFASATATPTSSFVVDTTAPTIPTGLAVTGALDATDPTNQTVLASVTWTQTTVSDLAGFAIRYRKAGSTNWNYINVNDSAARAATVVVSAGSAYDFQIKSFDFSQNTAGFTATAAMASVSDTTPPAAPTGLTLTASQNGITANWTENTETDVKNGAGTYEVTIATNSGFTTGVLIYNTGANSITITGLATATAYWVRLRAKDSSGNFSTTFSTSATATTGTFPGGANSNGTAPATSPAATALGTIGNVFVSWPSVTSGTLPGDTVKYEIHCSTTSTFTPTQGSATTLVGTVYGNFATIEKDAAGTPLAYGTLYYFRIIAGDMDGWAAPGTVSAGTSPAKALATDITLAPSDIGAVDTTTFNTAIAGKNKVTYSTAVPGTTSNNAGDVWFQYDTTSTNIIAQFQGNGGTSWTQRSLDSQVIASLAVGKLTAGTLGAITITVPSTGSIQSADYVAGTTGFLLKSGALDIRSGTVAANTIVSGTGIVNNLIVNTGGAVTSSNYVAGTTGFKLSTTGLELNSGSVTASALTAGTISSQSISLGVGGILSVDGNTGQIKSNNYAAGSTGWRLSFQGLEINDGTIDAKAIKTSTISASTITLGSTGALQSSNYVAATTGWQLSSSGLEINGGTIRAAALQLQAGENIIPPQYADFEFNSAFYTSAQFVLANAPTVISDTATSRFNKQSLKVVAGATSPTVDMTTGATSYNIPVDGAGTYIVSIYVSQSSGAAQNINLRFKDNINAVQSSANLSVPSVGGAWTRVSATFTTAAGATGAWVGLQTPASTTIWFDGMQVERQTSAATAPSSWMPSSSTSINGGMITTGSIQSTSLVSTGQSAGTQPQWLIDTAGNAVFANALVRGHLVVGDSTNSGNTTDQYIVSTNYVAGSSGWIIKGDGSMEMNTGTFRGLLSGATGSFSGTITATGGSITGNLTVSGGVIRTAAGGLRVELSSAAQDTVSMFTGDPLEALPPQIWQSAPAAGTTTGHTATMLSLLSGQMASGGVTRDLARIDLTSAPDDGSSNSSIAFRFGQTAAGRSGNTWWGPAAAQPANIVVMDRDGLRVAGTDSTARISLQGASGNISAQGTITSQFSANAGIGGGFAGVILNNYNLQFRGVSDGNHYMAWSSNTADGPDLFGYTGLKFGTMNGGQVYRMAMSTSALAPVADGGMSLGGSTLRWSTGFFSGNVQAPGFLFSPLPGTLAGTAAGITSGGFISKLSSSRRYKTRIRPADVNYGVLDLEPVTFHYKGDIENGDDEDFMREVGLIAEDVHEAGINEIVHYEYPTRMNEDQQLERTGEPERPESIRYDRIGVMLLPIVKDLLNRVIYLENRLALAEGR